MTNFTKLSCSQFNPQPKPEKIVKAKVPYKFKKKPTGEKEIFESIWFERGAYSEISGTHLGEFNICYFAHILPKGQNKFPRFKLRMDNICLMTLAEHTAFDSYRSKCIGKEWEWLYLKEAELKEEYKFLSPEK
jgi:hypothetical protein